MHATSKLVRQQFVNLTMSLQWPFAGKLLANRYDFKVTLGPCRHIMTVAFIRHFQMLQS
jgi:hypothetical protein